MGPERGDATSGDEPETHSPWEPPLIEVELLAEDTTLPGDAPNTAASGTETIGGGGSIEPTAPLTRLARRPGTMRVLGALVLGVALSIALWPSSGPGEPRPAPAPTTPEPTRAAMNVDLYKVRVAGTSFSHNWHDHAIMGLVLFNDAPARLTIINAELWDAVGTRLGVSSQWPAADIDATGVQSVPLTLPYACNDVAAPVLPVTIRYSVSSPQDLGVSHNYEYPLVDTVWNQFAETRASVCGGGPEGGVFVDAVDTRDPGPDSHDQHSFDLIAAFDSVRQPGWTLKQLSAAIPGVTVTTTDLPLSMTPGRASQVRMHWQFTDCSPRAQWSTGSSDVEAVNVTYSEGAGDGDQQVRVFLRPELLAKMFQAACAR